MVLLFTFIGLYAFSCFLVIRSLICCCFSSHSVNESSLTFGYSSSTCWWFLLSLCASFYFIFMILFALVFSMINCFSLSGRAAVWCLVVVCCFLSLSFPLLCLVLLGLYCVVYFVLPQWLYCCFRFWQCFLFSFTFQNTFLIYLLFNGFIFLFWILCFVTNCFCVFLCVSWCC